MKNKEKTELLYNFTKWILSEEEDITDEMIKKDIKTFLKSYTL